VTRATLSYPDGQRDVVRLEVVPNIGWYIRMKNGIPGKVVIVERVILIEITEASSEPNVLILVRQAEESI
jgi:hypothetical protein